MMPVTYTEWNRYNSSTRRAKRQSRHGVSIHRAGRCALAMQGGNVKGMYAFKFSQVLGTS
jgi:hypothetical protein